MVKILIVEDERDLAVGLRSALEDAGYVVELSFDGENGLKKGLDEDYDVIILDIIGLDSGVSDYLVKPFAGVELLARIKALLRRNSSGELPTVVMFTSIHFYYF